MDLPGDFHHAYCVGLPEAATVSLLLPCLLWGWPGVSVPALGSSRQYGCDVGRILSLLRSSSVFVVGVPSGCGWASFGAPVLLDGWPCEFLVQGLSFALGALSAFIRNYMLQW